jgi:hypothetical protein
MIHDMRSRDFELPRRGQSVLVFCVGGEIQPAFFDGVVFRKARTGAPLEQVVFAWVCSMLFFVGTTYDERDRMVSEAFS